MATIRAFASTTRISTAVHRAGRVLQVAPAKRWFDTEADWRAAWTPKADRFEKETPAQQLPPSPVVRRRTAAEKRRRMEFAEFFDPSYTDMFTSVTISRERNQGPMVRVTLQDGSKWVLQRSLDFFHPPNVLRNGVLLGTDCDWYPSLTSVRWLLMLACLLKEC